MLEGLAEKGGEKKEHYPEMRSCYHHSRAEAPATSGAGGYDVASVGTEPLQKGHHVPSAH